MISLLGTKFERRFGVIGCVVGDKKLKTVIKLPEGSTLTMKYLWNCDFTDQRGMT